MTPEQEKQFEELFSTFNSEGWKLFIEEVDEQLGRLKENNDLVCETNDVWQMQRGIMRVLRQISNYENATLMQYEQIKQDEEANDASDV